MVSDSVAIAGISAVVGIFTLIATIVNKKLDRVTNVSELTHLLVNGNCGVQLKQLAELSQFKATHTGNQSDIDAALLAEKLYVEHRIKQAAVDAAMKTLTIIALALLICFISGCTSGCQGRQSPGSYRDTGDKTNNWTP